MKFIFKILMSLLIMTEFSHANEIKVFEFTEAELSQLEVRKVEELIIILFTQLDLMKW